MCRLLITLVLLALPASQINGDDRLQNDNRVSLFDRLKPGVMPDASEVDANNRPMPFCQDSKNGKCLIYWENFDSDDRQLVAVNPMGTIKYPALQPGFIVAMFGRLYRFDSNGEFVKFNPDSSGVDLKIERDSVAIPLNQKGKGRFSTLVDRKNTIARISVSSAPNEKGDRVSVTVRKRLDGSEVTHTLSEREDFTVDELRFRLRRIVPRDSDNSVLGWAEFGIERLK